MVIDKEDLDRLDRLRRHSRSLVLRQAALIGLIQPISKHPNDYTLADVYYSYMQNSDDDGFAVCTDKGREKENLAAQWIQKNSSELLPLFIQDLHDSFRHEQAREICKPKPHIQVASAICKTAANKFRQTVRE
ncbi:unnamed protein product, partial [Rotaria sp. Silwood1]